MASGWYADPLGRHEKRFFNGLVWTDRVVDGDHTGSDPIGNVSPPTPLSPRNPRADSGVVPLPSRGNASAITALVLGVVGAIVALLVPFGFVPGAVCGLIGLLFGLRAYRAVEHRNAGPNALATAGLALGSAALILAAYYGSSYYKSDGEEEVETAAAPNSLKLR